MLPEQGDAFIVLHVLTIGGTKYAAEHGGGNNLRRAEFAIPSCSLAARVMHKAFVGIDGGVGNLAFDRHHAAVAEPGDNIRARAGKPCLAAKLAGIRRGGKHRNVAGLHLLEVDAGE